MFLLCYKEIVVLACYFIYFLFRLFGYLKLIYVDDIFVFAIKFKMLLNAIYSLNIKLS